MRQKINIITPVFYDVPSFSILRENIIKALNTSLYDINFFIVDDSSGADLEIHTISELQDCQVITPPFNLGHQRAIVYAIRKKCQDFVDNEIIVTLDSDGEDSPEDLPRLLGELNKSGGFTLAKRTKRQESPLFKLLYVNFKLFFYTLTGTVIKSGNFMTYRASSIKEIIYHPYFNLCYSSVFLALRIRTNYVPCERGKRYVGESKMNTTNLIAHGIRMLMPFVEKIATRFLIFFSGLFTATLIASLASVSVYLFTNIIVPKSLLITLLGTLIVSSLSLGNLIVLFTVSAQTMKDSFNFIDNSSKSQNKLNETIQKSS
jgi:polyisoprenyl-phosphate glycosyltransferase